MRRRCGCTLPESRGTANVGPWARTDTTATRGARARPPTPAPLRPRRLRPRPRRARAQPEERRRRHPARRAGRLHRRLRLGQVVARVRHALRRGAAALPRVGRPVRAPAVPPDGRRRRSTRSTACRRPSRCSSSAASPTTRSSVGSVTTLSNLLRMLYSRAGDYPPGQPHPLRRVVLAEHAGGRLPDVPRARPGLRRDRGVDGARRLADDPRARDRRLAAGVARAEPARHRHHARLRHRRAVARAAEEGPRLAPVHRRAAARCRSTPATSRTRCGARSSGRKTPSYMGTFTGARRYVLQTFAKTQSALMKKRVAQYMVERRLPGVPRQAAAAARRCRVTFAGLDIAEISRLPLKRLAAIFRPYADGTAPRLGEAGGRAPGEGRWSRGGSPRTSSRGSPSCSTSASATSSLERSTPTLSPGELQRLRLATQVRSNLFGVVYVLDEPSAGLHPADTEALLAALDRLKAAGQLAVRRRARARRDPPRRLDRRRRPGRRASTAAQVLYSGPPDGLREGRGVADARATCSADAPPPAATPRTPQRLAASSPASRATTCTSSTSRSRSACFTTVTGVSGSGKSSLVSQVLVELVADAPRPRRSTAEEDETATSWSARRSSRSAGGSPAGMERVKRLVARRPEADRPHAALEPRDLHRAVRPRPQAVRRDEGGARRGATTPGGSRSTSPRGAARTARARGSSSSSCCSCRASTRRARPATARATTRRRWRSSTAARTSPTCSA